MKRYQSIAQENVDSWFLLYLTFHIALSFCIPVHEPTKENEKTKYIVFTIEQDGLRPHDKCRLGDVDGIGTQCTVISMEMSQVNERRNTYKRK
jgi:hypothetical protein